MALATVTNITYGSTMDSAPLNSNFTNLKNSVNSIATEQLADSAVTVDKILDNTITSAKIASSGIVLTKLLTASVDASLGVCLENFIDGCDVYRIDSTHIGVTKGSAMINGKLRRNTDLVSSTYSAPDDGDWLDVWLLADADATTFTVSIVDAGTSPGDSSNPGTNGRIAGSIRYVETNRKIAPWRRFKINEVYGWDYIVGNDTAAISTAAFKFGVSFLSTPIVLFNTNGYLAKTSYGADLSSFTNDWGGVPASTPEDLTASQINAKFNKSTNFSSSYDYAFSFIAKGRY